MLLLISTIAVVTLSLVDLRASRDDIATDLGLVAVSLFVGATFLVALRASGVARRYRIIADIVVTIGLLATILILVAEVVGVESASENGTVGLSGAPPLVWLVLAALAPVVVVRRLTHHKRATRQTLAGAVSAYLLIAIAFDFAFLAVDAVDSTPFFGQHEPTTSFMYFSLTTMTTLGYGDLAAAEPLGQFLATIEAVLGQVYLVTFVAMIVGLLVAQRQSEPTSDQPLFPGSTSPDLDDV